MESDVSQDDLLDEDDLAGEDAFDEDIEEDLDGDLDTDLEDDEAVDDLESYDDAAEEDDELDVAAALDATGDNDDEEASGQPAVDLAVLDGLEEDSPVDEGNAADDEGLREGEFVCSSCHMARRGSALADPDEMLCRDCV